MKEPEVLQISPEELDAMVERAERGELEDGDAEIIKAAVETLKFLYAMLKEKDISIKRLQRIIFGSNTEKTKNVLKSQEEDEGHGRSGDEGNGSESVEGGDTKQADDTGSTAEEQGDKGKQTEESTKTKGRGHGRNGVAEYRGAERVYVPHQILKPGDPCPECPKGKVYEIKKPAVLLRLSGRSPLQAKVYELQQLRCNLCGKVFVAEAPEECGKKKWDASAGSIIALLKYGSGFPFNRLEALQKNFEVPVPDSTQWDVVEAKADRIYPVYDELIRQAAQGEVLHNDDTTIKILELMKENKDREKDLEQQDQAKQGRTGMFTTGIVSIVPGGHKIALFFTGRNYAGENLERVLQYRDEELGPPIQMCDGLLSRNVPKDFAVILANCLCHGRRNFVDLADLFPVECRFLLETLKQVYKNDAKTKAEQMSDEQRLRFHQAESGPLMMKLEEWLEAQIEEKTFEPNSSMAKAVSYMLDHWQPLTLFLREPGAPLDNNICERTLKRAILHRKNALFFKTEHGAYIGDLYMSIIHSCDLGGVNAFEYLNALEEHSEEVFRHPERWLPWNYRQQLTAAAAPPV